MSMGDDVLLQLAATIRERRAAAPESSYTRQLLDAGPARCGRKLGEEAIETIIAAIGENDEAVMEEAADVLYHLVVLLESREIALADVLAVLRRRVGVSGLKEKADRTKG
jgi:phosphoribosyl-ATP pyrophosphohydrolase